MMLGLRGREAISATLPKQDGPADFAARELIRVARKFIPASISLKDCCDDQEDELNLPEELRKVTSQLLLRPTGFLQDVVVAGARKRAASSGKQIREDKQPSHRLRRSTSDTRPRKGSAAEVQPSDLGRPLAGPRLTPKRVGGLAREEELDVVPVWQSKESDRPCLVPPLCTGVTQLEADKSFFDWANQIVQDVAEDATSANFSLSRVPGPPPVRLLGIEAFKAPCSLPPWASQAPTAGVVC